MKLDCFILAAGEGQRMFPLSSIMEKSLLPVDGKPVIRIIVDNLTKPEVAKHLRKITICCLSKFKKQFEHEFRDMPSIEFKEFDKPCGTATTLYESMYKGSSEWIMVHYADCITEIDYVKFIRQIPKMRKSDGIIAVTNKVKHDYSEVVLQDGSKYNKVWTFKEKPQLNNYTWSGIAIFKTKPFLKTADSLWNKYCETSPIASAMQLMTKQKPYYDIAFDIFPQMIKLNSLSAFPYNGEWYDVGNLNSYRKLCEIYNNH